MLLASTAGLCILKANLVVFLSDWGIIHKWCHTSRISLKSFRARAGSNYYWLVRPHNKQNLMLSLVSFKWITLSKLIVLNLFLIKGPLQKVILSIMVMVPYKCLELDSSSGPNHLSLLEFETLGIRPLCYHGWIN